VPGVWIAGLSTATQITGRVPMGDLDTLSAAGVTL